MPDDRTQLTIRLTDNARHGWDEAAHRAGVSLTALLESCGLVLFEDPDQVFQRGADIVQIAKQVDRVRRTRRPGHRDG